MHGDPTSFTWKHLLATVNQLLIPDRGRASSGVFRFPLLGPAPVGSPVTCGQQCIPVWLRAHLHMCQPGMAPGAAPRQGLLSTVRAQAYSWGAHSHPRAHSTCGTHQVLPGPKLFLVKVQIGARDPSREAEKNFTKWYFTCDVNELVICQSLLKLE